VSGFVQDFFVDNKPANLLAFMFVDYTMVAFRADEIWNTSAIMGTGLGSLGLEADHHLNLGNQSYFYYSNNIGSHCSKTASVMLPQDSFSNPSTYVGNQTLPDGTNCLHFVNYTSSGNMEYLSEGFVDIETMLPRMLYQNVTIGNLNVQALQYFLEFEAVDEFPNSDQLFALPKYCGSSNEERREEEEEEGRSKPSKPFVLGLSSLLAAEDI